MALMKPGPIGLISGIVGGTEIALTRNGPVAKKLKRNRRIETPRYYRAQKTWNHRADLWHELDPDAVLQWKRYAETHPIRNRLGTQVYLTAFQIFQANLLDTTYTYPYPDLTSPPAYPTEEVYDFTATITAGGPYTITVPTNYTNPSWLTLNLWVARWLPKHSQRTPTTWINVGTYQHTGDLSTWYERFQARNIDLVQNERIALKVRKHYIFSWPSMPTSLFTTVL